MLRKQGGWRRVIGWRVSLGCPRWFEVLFLFRLAPFWTEGEGLQEPRSLGLRCVEYEGVQLGWHLRRRPKRLLVCGDMVIDMMQ